MFSWPGASMRSKPRGEILSSGEGLAPCSRPPFDGQHTLMVMAAFPMEARPSCDLIYSRNSPERLQSTYYGLKMVKWGVGNIDPFLWLLLIL